MKIKSSKIKKKTHSYMKSFKCILTIAPFVKATFSDEEVWLSGGIIKPLLLSNMKKKLAKRKKSISENIYIFFRPSIVF
jgi:hypothetical protein